MFSMGHKHICFLCLLNKLNTRSCQNNTKVPTWTAMTKHKSQKSVVAILTCSKTCTFLAFPAKRLKKHPHHKATNMLLSPQYPSAKTSQKEHTWSSLRCTKWGLCLLQILIRYLGIIKIQDCLTNKHHE